MTQILIDYWLKNLNNVPIARLEDLMAMDSSTKISAKIWRPILDKLDPKLEQACLRRDAYLNRVLETELDYLDKEVSEPNTESARLFVAKRLDELDRKLVSITLRVDLVQKLDKICAEKLIVRDAFFNRLFLFLSLKPEKLEEIFFPGKAFLGDWKNELRSMHGQYDSLFNKAFYPLEAEIDPFRAIRAGLKWRFDNYPAELKVTQLNDVTGTPDVQIMDMSNSDWVEPPRQIYTIPLTDETLKGVDLHGLNCYLPVWRIPDTPEGKARTLLLDEM